MAYLKMNNVDLATFAKSDIKNQLGYFLEFLSFEGVTIEVNTLGRIVYFNQLATFINLEKFNDALVISSATYNESNKKIITDSYKLCIKDAFNRLENPF